MFIQNFLYQRSQPPSLVLGNDSKASIGMVKLYSEQRENFRCAMRGGYWYEGILDVFIRSRASYITGLRSIVGFL